MNPLNAWRGIAAVATLAAAALLGAVVLRSYALLIDAVPNPLGESAVQSLPIGAAGAESTLFIPDCAASLAVRFDPASAPRGAATVSFSSNQSGGLFPDVPMFQTSRRLEAMPGGVWTLEAPLAQLRGRAVRLRIRLADDARASLLMRAPRPSRYAHLGFDDRWASRNTPISGAVFVDRDPMRCLAARDAMPRWLRVPAIAFLGSVWMLVVAIVAWWMWPEPDREAGRQASARASQRDALTLSMSADVE